MKKISFFILLFCFSILIPNATLQAQLSASQLDTLIQNSLKKFNVAGVAIAIVKDGKIFYEKGFGVKSIATNSTVDVHTNFQIASNSKAFTTAALSILVDEKKIAWKDKVRDYLPEFKMYNDYVTENFLMEDLLCHRSGLGLGAGDLMDFPDGTDFTIKDKLTFAQYFKPTSAFRTQFDYDNQLYMVAGELIARVSGMTWEKFVQTRILDPLQMSNSFSALEAMKDKSNMSKPHSTSTGKIRTIDWFEERINGAAGGIVSNVDEMSKWMIKQLNKGKYGSELNKHIFTEARQKEMWTIHTVLPASDFPRYNQHFSGYGYAWDLEDIKGNLQVSHTGGLPGMFTSVTLIPDLKLGIVILTNTENGGGGLFSAVRQTIIDSYIGLDDFGWVEKYSQGMEANASSADSVTAKVWQTVAAAKNTKINAANYTGVYEDKCHQYIN
ncbi:MAG: serine hydrolase domain-containing protein [Ginsengibacter sp.]